MSVRVRFAPSPTGFLHLGGLRTALYNYLFARRNNGKFILRIEDTDQDRLVPQSMNNILDVLQWADIMPHEGPFTEDDYPNYVQSRRLKIYQEKANELLNSGVAYRCFCSLMRLELLRKEARKNGQVYRYDNRCRHLSDQEISDKLGQGEPHAIRFKLRPGFIELNDLVVGQSSVDTSLSEGDFVIMKSDSFPTYHLANVVDDHSMKITHVLRGTEWFKSTPKHIMLYDAFGWTPPSFAHLPVLLNEDGTKLSKRNDDFRVEKLRGKKYHPEVVLNFLVLTGGSWRPETIQIASKDELAHEFHLDQLYKQNTKLSLYKLNILNRYYIKQQLDTDKTAFLKSLREYLVEWFGEEKLKDETDERLIFLFTEVPERFNTFGDFANEVGFVWMELDPKWDCRPYAKLGDLEKLCKDLCDLISKEWDASENKLQKVPFIKPYCDSLGLNFKKVLNLMRWSVSNRDHGLPVGNMLFALGKDEFIRRIELGFRYTNEKLKEMEAEKSKS